MEILELSVRDANWKHSSWEQAICPNLSCHSFMLVRVESADNVVWTQFFREAGNGVFNLQSNCTSQPQYAYWEGDILKNFTVVCLGKFILLRKENDFK